MENGTETHEKNSINLKILIKNFIVPIMTMLN